MYYLNEITQLEEFINKVQVERSDIMKSNNLKVQEVFDRYFNYFKEFNIQVSGGSAYFRVKEHDETFKEIFTIYFHERYKEDSKLELSYYTTSTQSDFEVERLISLGKVARILRDNREEIIQCIKVIRKSDLERETELYRIQDGYEKEKRSYQKANDERRKTEIELSLRSVFGVSFRKEAYIQLKRNYTVRVNTIKIVEVSKSGKTCTVAFEFTHGHTSREENCSTESIISQVTSYSKDIVEALFPQ